MTIGIYITKINFGDIRRRKKIITRFVFAFLLRIRTNAFEIECNLGSSYSIDQSINQIVLEKHKQQRKPYLV